MKHLPIIIFAALSVFAASCGSHDIKCQEGALSVEVVGFTKPELDSGIVIRYKKAYAFDSLVDTAFKLAWTWNATIDTATLMPLFGNPAPLTGDHYFFSEYNYKIIFPSVPLGLAISGITLEGKATQHVPNNNKDFVCYNNVNGCVINGLVGLPKPAVYPGLSYICIVK